LNIAARFKMVAGAYGHVLASGSQAGAAAVLVMAP
jgi:hypothetical protein